MALLLFLESIYHGTMLQKMDEYYASDINLSDLDGARAPSSLVQI